MRQTQRRDRERKTRMQSREMLARKVAPAVKYPSPSRGNPAASPEQPRVTQNGPCRWRQANGPVGLGRSCQGLDPPCPAIGRPSPHRFRFSPIPSLDARTTGSLMNYPPNPARRMGTAARRPLPAFGNGGTGGILGGRGRGGLHKTGTGTLRRLALLLLGLAAMNDRPAPGSQLLTNFWAGTAADQGRARNLPAVGRHIADRRQGQVPRWKQEAQY